MSAVFYAANGLLLCLCAPLKHKALHAGKLTSLIRAMYCSHFWWQLQSYPIKLCQACRMPGHWRDWCCRRLQEIVLNFVAQLNAFASCFGIYAERVVLFSTQSGAFPCHEVSQPPLVMMCVRPNPRSASKSIWMSVPTRTRSCHPSNVC